MNKESSTNHNVERKDTITYGNETPASKAALAEKNIQFKEIRSIYDVLLSRDRLHSL